MSAGAAEEQAALPLVQQLLQLESRGQKERWEGLGEDDLEAEIATYKAALQEVVDEFRRLGALGGSSRAAGTAPTATTGGSAASLLFARSSHGYSSSSPL